MNAQNLRASPPVRIAAFATAATAKAAAAQ
jgi:TRAP-type uncharacterized transport system fused permease subunit